MYNGNKLLTKLRWSISFPYVITRIKKKKNHKLISSFLHPPYPFIPIDRYHHLLRYSLATSSAFPTSRNNRILAISFQYRISITWLWNEICSIGQPPRFSLPATTPRSSICPFVVSIMRLHRCLFYYLLAVVHCRAIKS